MVAEEPLCAFDQLDDAVLGQIFEAVGLASAYGHAQLWSLCRRFRRVLLEVRWAALDLGPAALAELAGASAEAHVALTRRICTLVSRHACGPNETGAAPRTSPRAWPFSGLASARWPRLVDLVELRRLSVSLELPPRSSGTSERTHALLRLAQPAWARICWPAARGAADALLSVLGEGPHPSVSRLELTARRFLGYEGHHLRSLLGRLPALAALALRTQPDDALDAGRRGRWRRRRRAAGPLEPAALAAAARLPALRSLAFPSTATPRPPSSRPVAVHLRRYGPDGARPERPLLAALASAARRAPRLSALSLRLVRAARRLALQEH
eukprot:tig00021254_g19710.t1